MTGAQARRLPGDRLHLHHGPIDLIVGADGPGGVRDAAFAAATARFASVLGELAAELPLLRKPTGVRPRGAIARAMHAATLPHRATFVTPMAAVAGAVADAVIAAMRAVPVIRASVNNGGDISLYLTGTETFRIALATLDNRPLGAVTLRAGDPCGIATSGLGGRSQTLGIADAVTVLARTAAAADAAATLIANAVDLPGHPAIRRVPASDLHPDSDLGALLVTTSVGALTSADATAALDAGAARARTMIARGLIAGAVLFLRDDHRLVGAETRFALSRRTLAHA